ncbi:alpha-L-fucosidase [Parapedobacter koreensis]|uniref:alpha-L-fucosidase n=1 Tax=Parapedobacter koreensis TaxID=332977 RepID=A0A1H7S6G4_9SPHI|nr:alpha-L-fucosidase [Parapedobacter koreensis]SEL67879.1 alpha-L-fucosidase [Parapedobacter koreensis]
MRITRNYFFPAAMALIACLPFLATAQHHDVSANYIPPTDPLVQKNLAEWQDLKFGLFMHWGTYSQWGVVESWSLCPEDEGWTVRRGPHAQSYFDYVKAYENLQTTFNPTQFNPEKWAEAAKQAGMKYVIFTTKHHDGFAMFDTKQSDYKITDSKTPFSSHPRANVTKEIFDAFRGDDFKIGTYFSKPDWHSDDYWWPYFPPKDRNVNYDPVKYPERWESFKNFTYHQIEELMTGYGKVDILWLDGGWVRPYSTIDTTVEWQRTIKTEQDIDMARIAAMARTHQPGLLVVDRTVAGEFENYVTPEQQVPSEPLDIPWESCLTMGNSWSYVPDDIYKPARQIVHTLVKIVSRGGNYLLNIGPGPHGDWDPAAYDRLRAVGEWITINGEGIYSTRTVTPYAQSNIFYTQHKDGNTSYAFLLSEDDSDQVLLPATIQLALPDGKLVKQVEILGLGKMKFKTNGNTLEITVPNNKRTLTTLRYAAAIKLSH